MYLTDIRYREPVYRVLGPRMRGVYPAFTGLVVVRPGTARVAGGDRRDRCYQGGQLMSTETALAAGAAALADADRAHIIHPYLPVVHAASG